MITKNDILLRIARLLILQGSSSKNIGLMNGKTGFSLFFFYYYQYTREKIYEDFAGELIYEVYKEINKNTAIGFDDGLCGIAWSIEYLIQNKFVEADANEILQELDERILEWDVRRIKDYSINTGLQGIAHYVINRSLGKSNKDIRIPKDYIADLIYALNKYNKEKYENETTILEKVVNGMIVEYQDYFMKEHIYNIKYKKGNIFNNKRPLGIDNSGFSGIGLNLIFDEHE